ncbi:hypothetical protein BDF20DRAFT_292749 [Mycotypha africana]|uniref:uncharacterized protein n=1 Tax=Mycotypha africana TaxID=64632 RepID=UPI00230031F0|nr:uncharacterized protein BDF20DRAFT_292749 [Mycotypha africana]KAI8987858.1 hypothetical protein BDF20DRAFT_292749 [Mycotypha africana]
MMVEIFGVDREGKETHPGKLKSNSKRTMRHSFLTLTSVTDLNFCDESSLWKVQVNVRRSHPNYSTIVEKRTSSLNRTITACLRSHGTPFISLILSILFSYNHAFGVRMAAVRRPLPMVTHRAVQPCPPPLGSRQNVCAWNEVCFHLHIKSSASLFIPILKTDRDTFKSKDR